MATNNINTGRAPRRDTRNRRTMKILDPGVPQFEGNPVTERGAGVRRRLAEVQSNVMTGLPSATRDDLLRRAGLPVKRGRTSV